MATRGATGRDRELKGDPTLLRPFLNDASYLFGCGTHSKLAVVDPHADLVDDCMAAARIVAANRSGHVGATA